MAFQVENLTGFELQRIRRFDRNDKGRDWVMGDLHGCFTTLEHALRQIGFDTGVDRLFSVGDLVDRGPESVRVLEFLGLPWFHAVRGNHEQMLLDTEPEDRRAVHFWWANGGGWFFAETEPVRQQLRAVLADLPYVLEIECPADTVGIVHADVPRKQDWPAFVASVMAGDPRTLETALWGRYRALGKVKKGVGQVGRVYVGHTPLFDGMHRVGNVHCIDTGAVFGLRDGASGAALTLIELGTERRMVFPVMADHEMMAQMW